MKKNINKKDTNAYLVKMSYADKTKYGKHTIIESWECKGQDDLKRTLCDALDLRKDSNGFPLKSSLEDVTNALKEYADNDFILNEFKRQKKCYSCYEKLMKNIGQEVKLDKRTSFLLCDVIV